MSPATWDRPPPERRDYWIERLKEYEPTFDTHYFYDEIMADPNSIFVASEENGGIAHLWWHKEASEVKVVRLYPEGPDVKRIAGTLHAGVEAMLAARPETGAMMLYGHFTPIDNLPVQKEKCDAWKALLFGLLTVKLVTLSGGIQAWQAEGNMLDMRGWLARAM